MIFLLAISGNIVYNKLRNCRCDGIGRRSGLKIHRWRHRAGSSPATGTISSVHNGFQLWTLDFSFLLVGLRRRNPMLAIV